MGIYIASSLHNTDQVKRVRDRLAAHGVELTYDWSHHAEVSGQQHIGLLPAIAAAEIDGVVRAQCLLVLWPGRNGTHFELGMAFARRIPIVFLLPDPDNHTWTSFHSRPELTRVSTEDDAIQTVLEILRGDRITGCHIMDLYDEHSH